MFGTDGTSSALGSLVDLTSGLARLPTSHCIRRGLFIPGQGMSSAPAVCGAWLSGHQAALLAIEDASRFRERQGLWCASDKTSGRP